MTYTNQKLRNIRKSISDGMSVKEAMKKHGVSRFTIYTHMRDGADEAAKRKRLKDCDKWQLINVKLWFADHLEINLIQFGTVMGVSKYTLKYHLKNPHLFSEADFRRMARLTRMSIEDVKEIDPRFIKRQEEEDDD